MTLPTSNKKWINSLIFLRVPKTASTSVINALGERNLLWKHRGLLEQHFQKSPIYRGVFDTSHIRPPEIYQIFSNQVFEFFSFAVVRNPYDRLVSSWAFGRQKNLGGTFGWQNDLTFDEFVRKLYEEFQRGNKNLIPLHQQTEWTHSEIFRPDVILRFENLQKDWQNMIKTFDIPRLPTILPHANKSEHSDWQQYFNPETKLLTKEMFARDFELLNY